MNPPRTSEPGRYHAFISYSHHGDKTFAPAFQQRLEAFARHGREMRALRVFRDDANMSANPDLWGGIQDALASSDWLILFASPDAAESPWVGKEIKWWLENRSPERILIGVTSGHLAWDVGTGDFHADSTAVHQALRGALRAEPRWIDLRGVRALPQLDLHDPRVQEALAEFSAPLRGVDKDEVIGEHHRRRQRERRRARNVIVLLSVLLLIAVGAGVVAFVQGQLAAEQARTASARLLASTAVSEAPVNATRAALLAAEGYRLNPDSQTRSALFQVLNGNPDLVRQRTLAAPVTSLVASASGVVYAGTTDGRLIRWDPSSNATTETRLGESPITDIATDDDGSVVAADDGRGAVLWRPGTEPKKLDHPTPGPVAVSPDGATVVVLTDPFSDVQRLDVFEASTGQRTTQVESDHAWDKVGFPDPHTIALVSEAGSWQRLRLPDLQVIHRQDEGVFPRTWGEPRATSEDGSFTGYVGYGSGDVISTIDPPDTATGFEFGSGFSPAALAIRGDGKKVAASGGGRLFLADTIATPEGGASLELTGTGDAEQLAFIGESNRLVSARGTTLSLWDPDQLSRMRLDAGNLTVPDTPRSSKQTRMAVSPDGRRALIVGGRGDIVLHDLRGGPEASVTVTPPPAFPDPVRGSSTFFPDWIPDGTPVLIENLGSALYAVRGNHTELLVEGQGAYDVAARLTANGERLTSVSEHGSMGNLRLSDKLYLDKVYGNVVQEYDPEEVRVAAISPGGRYAAWITPDEDWSGQLTVADSEQRRTVTVPGQADSVDFAGDRLLVGRPDGSLEVRDLPGTQLMRTIPGDTEFAIPMAWVPGTPFVGRLRNDGTVVVVDIDTGATLGELDVPVGSTFANDRWYATALVGVGETGELIAASPNSTVARWAINDRALLDLACRFAGRDLDASEWREVVGIDPPGDLRCHR
ncbi:TIR domain-containing protein [Saccharopolyspora sp. NPDC050389]|uniref:toll/interleukin-1 receptor domain-containing protein n=1 Tax=Saccharopolyspora sp. NPDC050389 TaxID=3155516 RepID=UPI0033D960FB